jgi:hypothetical protein
MSATALISHRFLYGRWRGSGPGQRRRGVSAVVAVLAGWLMVAAGTWFMWPSRFGLVLAISTAVTLGVLTGCAEDYGKEI